MVWGQVKGMAEGEAHGGAGIEATHREQHASPAHWDDPAPLHEDDGWRAVERHLLAPLCELDPRRRAAQPQGKGYLLHGSASSARLDQLHYCRLRADAFELEWRASHRDVNRHVVILQWSGTARVASGGVHVTVAPGDLVLARDLRPLQVAFDGACEQVVLFAPLPRHVLQPLGHTGLLHRPAHSPGVSMLRRWLADACAGRECRLSGVAASVSRAVQGLMIELFSVEQGQGARRLRRADIEREVTLHLQDPALTIGKLAALLGCSVRTLHRTFGREGGNSLERYIQRCRVDACAARLRECGDDDSVNLTQLALQFGFSSSSHFSYAFKVQVGVSPSAYRMLVGLMLADME